MTYGNSGVGSRRILGQSPVGLLILLICSPAFDAWAQLPPRPKDAVDPTKPALFVETRFIELGTIVEGESHDLAWSIENRGGAVLEIDRTTTTCGCTVVSLTDEQKRIEPGGTLKLAATFDSKGRRGDQTKSVTVYSNDPTEPKLTLEFHVNVEPLYNIDPPGIINLRMVRRGEDTQKTVDFFPAEGRKKLEIQEVVTDASTPVRVDYEPFKDGDRVGQRLRITIADDVPLGTLRGKADVRFTVDGMAREHGVVLHGEVVGDLVWRPNVLDMTRRAVTAGRKMPPVIVESTARAPVEITGVDAGPLFDVDVNRSKPTKQTVELTLRAEAPPGPFAALLKIRTGSVDQPVIEIPVFGIVDDVVTIDPPIILFRHDGTAVGTRRRVTIRAGEPSQSLRPSKITCDHPGVSAVMDERGSVKHRHMFALIVSLDDGPAGAPREATLTVETGNAEIGTLRIPVVIQSGS